MVEMTMKDVEEIAKKRGVPVYVVIDDIKAREEFKEALKEFSESARKLSEVWYTLSQDDDPKVVENYPFNESFDELMFKIMDWNDKLNFNE